MSNTEVFEYHLMVRDDANPALAKTATAAASAGGSSQALANGLANINEGAKNMASRLGPAAAAISSVSASLGAAGGSAGKFVAMGGQIAAAFGAGGPVGAAIVAGTVAVDAFSASLLKVEAAREAAFDKDFERQYGNILRISKATQDLNDQIRALDVDIMYAGVDGDDRATLLKQQEVFRKREEANNLRNQAGDARKVMLWSERERLNGQAKALEVEANKLEAIVDRAVKYKGTLDDIAASKKKAFGGARNDNTEPAIFDEYSFANTDLDIEAEKEAAKDRIREETAKLEQARQDRIEAAAKTRAQRIRDNEEMFANMRYEDKKRQLDAIEALEKSYADRSLDLAQSTFASALSVGQSYIDAKIRGEKDAEVKAVASFLSSTGQQLVASGTRALFEGAIISANPLTPGMGVPMMIAGGAAIAAGVGMGAASSAIGASLAPPSSGTGSAIREPGATPGSLGSGGTRTEAGVSFQIIYGGLSGPTADQGLRTLTKAQGMAAGRAGLVSRRQRFR